MRTFKVFRGFRVAACLAVCLWVLMAAETFTSVAGAATKKLWITHNAQRLKVGDAIETSFLIEGGSACRLRYDGSVGSNGALTDKLGFPTRTEHSCESGWAIRAGTLTWVMTSKGQLTITSTPKILISFPGYCVYEFTKLVGNFTPGQPLHVNGGASGKLDKAATLGEGCPETKGIGWEVEAAKEHGELVTELA
jgi:hypothetical protein